MAGHARSLDTAGHMSPSSLRPKAEPRHLALPWPSVKSSAALRVNPLLAAATNTRQDGDAPESNEPMRAARGRLFRLLLRRIELERELDRARRR